MFPLDTIQYEDLTTGIRLAPVQKAQGAPPEQMEGLAGPELFLTQFRSIIDALKVRKRVFEGS
jgi:hypothetical protein